MSFCHIAKSRWPKDIAKVVSPDHQRLAHRWADVSTVMAGNLLWMKLSSLGAQGRLPQNISQWHIDYFEFSCLKIQPVQEGQVDSPLSPWMQEINAISSQYQDVNERHVYEDREFMAKKPAWKKSYYFFTNILLKPRLC